MISDTHRMASVNTTAPSDSKVAATKSSTKREKSGAEPSGPSGDVKKAKLSEEDNANGDSASECEEKYTFFFGPKSPFSQHHPCKFTIDGIEYNCAEQYMMHQKAVIFKDKNMEPKILASQNPKEQKAFGRKVENFVPEVWSKNSRQIVKKANLAKFSQNDELLEALQATAGTILVEAAPRDRLWGIGLGAKNPKALNKANWRGRNWLGYTLTDVREELMKDAAKS